MPETTVAPTDFVSHSELIAGLRAVTEAAKAALLLGRDTQRLAFALADAQRLIRRAESTQRQFLAPVLATPEQIIPLDGVAVDLRAWEGNEHDAPANERFGGGQ